MKTFVTSMLLILIPLYFMGQNCSILSKANNITPDRLCSPVTALWNVSYTGVNDAGTPVSIQYDWDNGFIQTIPAVQVGPGIFEATSSYTYTSTGNICNYHPKATLMVNGVICTSSTQEQIVTVWDDDDHNGGRMHINPTVYPICFGNIANVRFQDLTLFNCVPPQERDNPNVNTRWIQWIYGTDITMTGTPVTVNGRSRTFPYTADVVTLPGPITGSGVWSEVLNVANDKLIGQYFQVTLRNWNYCNPYDDPNIPGGPLDRVNGDHPPVVTTAIILIVPYPDATITPVDPLCANADPVTLTAHDPGGTWSGAGITGNVFNPDIAGPGNHIIRHEITNSEGCSDSDETTISVLPVPDATIISEGIVCSTDPVFKLIARDLGGIWTGPGVTGSDFYPALAGTGNHVITYSITDENGCSDSDETLITVATPDATITPVDTLCVDNQAIILRSHDLGGVWSGPGVVGNTFNPIIAGIGNHLIRYNITNPECSDADSTVITVMPVPVISIDHAGTLFINGPSIRLNAIPAVGIWSGTGVTDNYFNPGIAGLGTHVIQYETIPDRWGCYARDTIHITVCIPPVPTAYFKPETTGCSPLTVSFINKSTYGESYLWDFGDKMFSDEENPTHTYYIPGNYIVRLTVTNIAGSSFHQGIIKVYQNPVSIFSVFPTEVITNSQIVTFQNHSYYATIFKWDFGDGSISTDENPWHKYESDGTYLVSLKVISKDGCMDSSVYKSPIVVAFKDGEIKFPNAFLWNRSGPTGGYWNENQLDDFTFRPFFANVLKYTLQIFNRWGTLIYESNDIHKGWDGYYGNGNLGTQGVYVWKATGQFADGKYFNLVGDVTFLH